VEASTSHNPMGLQGLFFGDNFTIIPHTGTVLRSVVWRRHDTVQSYYIQLYRTLHNHRCKDLRSYKTLQSSVDLLSYESLKFRTKDTVAAVLLHPGTTITKLQGPWANPQPRAYLDAAWYAKCFCLPSVEITSATRVSESRARRG
jgi:hypothetical protein